MASILIVSSDQNAVARLTEIVRPLEYRVRSVVSLDAAREWLSLNDFDALFVDSRYGDGQSIDLVEFAWKTQPYLVAALFNFDGPVEDEWTARLQGIRVFSDRNADHGITTLLESQPRWRSRESEYRVLLVEDLDSPRDIICSYIETLGYLNVRGVSSVTEGLAELRKHPNDYFAIVTDINMPKQSGVELIQEVRRDEALHHIPVIVLTAYATAEHLVETVRAGATGFLVKPPKKRLLRAELEKAKRIFITHQSPRLCKAEDAHFLEAALSLTLR